MQHAAGDFATSGHYILLYDYDGVKDSNRSGSSSSTRDYVTLSLQIKHP